MMNRRKIIAMIAALAMLLTLVAGCGGADTPAPDTSSDAAPADSAPAAGEAPAEDITITVALMSNDWLDAAEQIAADFTAKYGIKVEYTPMPGEVEEYLQPKAASGSLPDVMSINAGAFGADLAENGLIIDLAEIDAAKNMVESLKPVFTSSSGKLFGVAGGLSSTLIYYNKAMFEDAGITEEPKNWDEFLAACEKLKAAGYAPLSVAMGDGAISNTAWSTGNAVEIAATDPQYIEKIANGTYNFDTPEQARIFERVKILNDNDYLLTGSVSAMVTTLLDSFKQEKSAMCFQGIWMAGAFMESPFEVGMMVPPWNMEGQEQAVVLGTETGFAVAEGPNKEAGIKFVNYIANEEGFYTYQQSRGSIPSLIEYDESKVKMTDDVKAYVEKLLQIKTTGAYWFEILPPSVYARLPQTFQQVATNEITPQEAAKTLQDLYTAQ
ncbi:ABC transporter substrate-binding protein [Youxingia wuxianensis]|uniref:Extracellular solute-binding protein n=1 Tax=Youxingia wuxianensis TaxID=2763678 RepID=A0A926EN29_9FIRM|nr:extracellular solute-binding protein [Youxingia wuxianensis]MBC8585365.1 extracellular solute-binding protein [Youxingia wuxianensis]